MYLYVESLYRVLFAVPAAEYLGCYKDSGVRALGKVWVHSTAMTRNLCMSICAASVSSHEIQPHKYSTLVSNTVQCSRSLISQELTLVLYKT